MSANAEIIAELRRVLNERDEAREQLDLTKRELGRWVDRETKAVRERDQARDKYEALAVLVDGYRRERDEAREERDLARERFENAVQSATRYAVERDEWRDKFLALNQTAGELCNACGWAFKIPGESCRCEVVKERDEARAEVERQRELKDYLRTWLSSEELEGLRVKAAEHPLLWEEIHHWKAEVERLRVELIRAGSRECDIAACNCGTWHHQSPRAAYRRGAEAMREACAQWFREHDESFELTVDACHDVIADMPIPEEP